MTENVFVLGLDESNRATLERLPGMSRYRFHALLNIADLRDPAVPLPRLLEDARAQLDAFDGTVDAIVGYWDFPVSSLVPMLCAERGLPSTPLESVVRCEHKYWSRLEQSAAIAEVPAFATVDLTAERPPETVSYPMWLKPVKSYSSELAFRVRDDAEFQTALERIRAGVGRVGERFEYVLKQVALPDRVARAGGTACLAEEEVGGRQATVEGYVWRGEPVVYGVVESHCYPDSPSFLRYQYPSELPGRVLDRLGEVSRRVVRRMGLDSTTFNIEYFWDPESDAIRLLEINPRHSQSHARLFEMVDGVANHERVVRLALGREPEWTPGHGDYAVAAKWFLRRFTDGVVTSVPDAEDIARLERDVPGASAAVLVEPGARLSELSSQDSYSYALAEVMVGARDTEELWRTFELCLARLPFGITDSTDAGEVGEEE